MKCPLPFVTSLLAVFALIAGAWTHGDAQARPHASELHSIVICAEAAAETVLLDARGLPVQPEDCAQGLCPDCLPVPPLALAAAGWDFALPVLRELATAFAPWPTRKNLRRPARLPRGPPALT